MENAWKKNPRGGSPPLESAMKSKYPDGAQRDPDVVVAAATRAAGEIVAAMIATSDTPAIVAPKALVISSGHIADLAKEIRDKLLEY